MKIRIDLKIIIFMLIFYFTHQLRIYLIIMFFCIFHEIGHLLTGIILKVKPEKIEIMPCGLSISFYKNVTNCKIKELIIVLAGPITSALLAILSQNIKFAYIMKEEAVYSNILILLFNLIPIYPLDGGRILKSLLHIEFGSQEAKKIINIISNIVIIMLTIVASITVYYFKNIAIFLICIFLWIITIQENIKFKNETKIYEMIKNS